MSILAELSRSPLLPRGLQTHAGVNIFIPEPSQSGSSSDDVGSKGTSSSSTALGLVTKRPAGQSSGPARMIQMPPLLSSSSLTLARFLGKYIHIMQALSPLAVNALYGLAELFDFYLYTVFNLFGVAAHKFYEESFGTSLYPRLRAAVMAVRERIEAGSFGRFVLNVNTSNTQLLPVFCYVQDGPNFSSPSFLTGGAGSSSSIGSAAPTPALIAPPPPVVQPPPPPVQPPPEDNKETTSGKFKFNFSFGSKDKDKAVKPSASTDRMAGGSGGAGAGSSGGAGTQSDTTGNSGLVKAILGPSIPQLVRLHNRVQLSSPQQLYGLVERVIAAESLVCEKPASHACRAVVLVLASNVFYCS